MKVGDIVLCINNGMAPEKAQLLNGKKLELTYYTVKDIEVRHGVKGILLEEIEAYLPDGTSILFRIDRFIKIDLDNINSQIEELLNLETINLN
jgi:hypothetical protein